MKIHEYQAKALFREYGIQTPRSVLAHSAAEAVAAAKELGGNGPWVVKAQIHAGGRGKGGGIKLSKSVEEVESNAAAILGQPLVTPQTGSEGKTVYKLLVEEGCQIAKELYCAAVLNRETASISFMASTEGGMDIEEVAAKTPEKIKKIDIDPAIGFTPFQGRAIAYSLGLDKNLHKPFAHLMRGLVRLFLEKDCSLAEINPLVITQDGDLLALDGKINFDDSGLFRHPDIAELADPQEEDPRDLEAAKWGLNYIHLDGNIGCMVNGAGLAMATMDIIKQKGGDPANFLDVGGGASAEMVREAFKILVSDPKVEAIFVNIFGGIMKCDVLAEGIVQAVAEVGLKIPLVVRLEGTNVEKGREILKTANMNIVAAADMADGAEQAVKLAGAG